MNKVLQVVLFVSISLFAKAQQQNIFDSVSSRNYAKYLLTSHQFKLASEEFERLYFLSGNKSEYLSSLIYSLRKAELAENAISRFASNKTANADVFREYFLCLINQKKSVDAISMLQNNTTVDSNTYHTLSTILFASNYNWNKAKNACLQIRDNSATALSSVIIEAANKKKKSPLLAGALSTVVPGLGKFYAGNKKDAFISFIFVGVNTFQTIRYFNKKGIKSAGGWIFGSLATGFYLGNIYGAIKAVKLNNRKIDDAYKNKILDIVGVD